MSNNNKDNNQTALSTLTPAAIAKKLSEIVPANTKETIEETKQYLNSQKLDLDGYRQIWKGIFFAMWASDKVPVQQELAEELANLVFSVYKMKFEAINLWFQACFNIMNKEWNKIDYWRVNKFSSLMRKVLAAFIRYLRKKGFNTDYVRQFNKTINQELYVEITQTVGGLALHIMQIFPEVLSNFSFAKHDQVVLILDLFLKQLNPNICKNLRQKIKECIFDKIIELKNEKDLFQNLNMKAYREKLFDIAKKKKTDDVSRKELYEVVELIDATVDLEKEENRYQTYIKLREENRKKVKAEKEANGKIKGDSKKKNQEQKEVNKKEDKTNKKANLEGEESVKQKKQKLNDANVKNVETKQKPTAEQPKKSEEQNEKKATESTKQEQKLTKQEKKNLKKEEKLQQMIEEEVKKLAKEEKKLNQMEQKLAKQDKKEEKLSKSEQKNLKKKLEEVVAEEEDDEEEEEDQDWEDEQDDDENEDLDDDDEEEEQDEEDGEDEELYGNDMEFDEEDLDEEELQMLIKGTAEDIEIDDMDDDFYSEDDFEGYDIQDVMNNSLKINGLQNVYNSLPEYHFLSDPQKIKYFNNLTSKFKQNLLKEKIDGCSHKKSVIINTNNNSVKEFDLNEEVIAISKSPAIKKAKKVKLAVSS